MASADKPAFGVFENGPEVDRTVALLESRGFRTQDVSVLMPQTPHASDLGFPNATKAPEGIAAGVTGGALVGGSLGWLVGLGSLAIPGLGPFLAAGPLMGALAGAGVGGAVGGITGALIGLGIPEYEARRYEDILKGGSILVSVHAGDAEAAARAKTILVEAGARDVHVIGEVGVANPGFRTYVKPYPKRRAPREKSPRP